MQAMIFVFLICVPAVCSYEVSFTSHIAQSTEQYEQIVQRKLKLYGIQIFEIKTGNDISLLQYWQFSLRKIFHQEGRMIPRSERSDR